jgi:o-succinylbenzoate---CoA ligase
MRNTDGHITIDSHIYPATFFLQAEPVGYFLKSQFLSDVFGFLHEWFTASPMLTVQTSGSTGTPKTVQLSKKTVWESALKTCDFFSLNERSTALLCLPVRYIAGKLMLVRAIACGMNLICVEPSKAPLTELDQYVDFAALTPMQLKYCIDTPESLAKSGIVLTGGAPVDNSLIDSIAKVKTRVYQSYGMTETATHVALRLLNQTENIPPFEALQGVHFDTDSRNCLIIYAPHVSESPLFTNDVVEFLSPTQFYWKGRHDFVINTGGIKVFPEEIERKLSNIIKFPFYITHIPDSALGQKVVLVLELKNKEKYEQLKENLNNYIEVFEKPRDIILTETIRFNENGKIIREH